MKNQIHYYIFKKRGLTITTALFLSASVFFSHPAYAGATEAAETVGTVPLEEPEIITEEGSTLISITAITPLSEDIATLSFDDKPSLEEITAKLPATLSVTLSDSSVMDLPVTWNCNEDYINTSFDTYTFHPSWDTAAYPLSPELDAYTAIPYITVNVLLMRADTYLSDTENAKSSLDSLAKSKPLLALVYLCDSYEVKQAPGTQETTAGTAVSGQSVQITGVSEDSFHNIWYQVSIPNGDTSYSGYIQREYLAYSDEDLLAWEQENITTPPAIHARSMRSFSAAPKVTADIMQFPDSYQDALVSLKSAHPNWIFVKMNTNVDWNTAVTEENKEARSLISSNVNAAWKTGPYDRDNAWSYPTDGILAYYMDPRNFLTEKHIFQFELLSYNKTYHTENAVQSILNDTFMSGAVPGDSRSYAQIFCSIAQELDVSPFHLAARVRQEQGSGTSPLISGTYSGYEGYYNYFNIGATGKSDSEVIVNGLKKAKDFGWNSRFLSLKGGSEILSKNYIWKGQNTLYLQKFNVNKESASGLYQHQYMQNIAAPSSEAVSVKNAYARAGSLENTFVFRIPVFDNMPGTACVQPSPLKELKLNRTSLTLKADEAATLTATIDGTKVDFSSLTCTSSDSTVATIDSNGTVTALSAGTTTITCSVSGAASATCVVTVEKTDPTKDPNYVKPVLKDITYNPSKALSSIALPSGWQWDNPTIIPTVKNSGYPATYTPVDTNKYNTTTQVIPLHVLKGTPAYQIPGGLESIAGNTLASLRLPAGFIWESPNTVLEQTGSYHASYNPDPDNYETVTKIAIPVTVTKKEITCTTHSYGEWITTKEPTCTDKGIKERSCLTCGQKETDSVPALSHDYSAEITKPATESEAGVRTYTCSRCKTSYTETIDKLPTAHTHQYSAEISTAAACTGTGIKTYTCSCGDTYTESIPALGHSYTSEITKEATEKEMGIRTYTCSRCKDTYTETIAKLPASHTHQYTGSVSRQASCTEKGIQTYTCSCGDTYTEEISALGHDMANGTCRRCGYTDPNHNSSTEQNTGQSSESNGSSSENTSGNSNNSSSTNSNSSGSNNATNTPNSSGIETTPAPGNTSNTANTNGSAGSTVSHSADSVTTHQVTIDMKETSVLYEETIASIRGKDIDIILNMGNSISWIINGSNIVADEANGIDMGVSVNMKSIPEELMVQAANMSETGTIIELSLAHNGSLDFKPVLTVNTASDNAGRTASLFYYNPEKNQLEFIEETEVTESGDICFTFSHASDYAVIISDTSLTATKVIAPVNTTQDTDNTGSADNDENAMTAGSLDAEATKDSSQEGFLTPSALFIIGIILLVVVAIVLTALYLWKSKETYEDDYSNPMDDDQENIEFIDEFEPDKENCEFDDDEFDGFE